MPAHTFRLDEAIQVLSRTPRVLSLWLGELAPEWIASDEGPETFSAFDVVGHLIHGEKTDWMPRLRRIREHGESLPFEPFDRFAQKSASRGKSLGDLLEEFARLREANLSELRALELTERDLALRGRHPELGSVTLRELLATWVVHDLGHLAQIARVMSKRYAADVGPWKAYLPVLTR
jgi:uncharacterized damage-inducible protein DinB